MDELLTDDKRKSRSSRKKSGIGVKRPRRGRHEFLSIELY